MVEDGIEEMGIKVPESQHSNKNCVDGCERQWFKTFNISPFSTLSSDSLTYFIALSQNSTPARGQRGQNGIAALKLLIWAKVFEAR